MGASFFIPKKINVGFQERESTYTGKLAYIIYFDERGKLRKEASWNGWRDKKIENEIHDNEPTSGFVLNKKAGGYSTGWNHRQTYVRVYDPRGFEFEVTVPNLLYILENATSTKGKGLEGEFIYGWDGKDLVLIPVDSPDYQELVKLNKLRHSKEFVKAKELKIGATYRTKQNEELIYMGKFDEYNWRGEKHSKPSFWFYKRNGGWKNEGAFETMKTISQKLVEAISEECVSDYAEIFEKMECRSDFSPVDESKEEYIPLTLEELAKKVSDSHYYTYILLSKDNQISIRKNNNGDGYYYEYKNPDYNPKRYYSWERNDKPIDERLYLRKTFANLEEVIEQLKPVRRRQYLANGKIYSEGY